MQVYDKIDNHLYCCEICALNNGINKSNIIKISDDEILNDLSNVKFWFSGTDINGNPEITSIFGDKCACGNTYSFIKNYGLII